MQLEGSCHCQAISFRVEAPHPYPFNLCYCSICRKTAGGGGYAINLGGRYETLTVQGAEHLRKFRARINGEISVAERYFCGQCGSALWLYDKRWPDLIHPHASAIDTELPIPPQRTHMMLGSKAPWVDVKADEGDLCFDTYPDESLAEWHARHGLDDA
ncbi:alanine acetyltransferase [Alkalilimnicola ehrlichii]|uniref:Alanine acetyltransferase n=1 Tax=Alkalilimnicola ehrlichii TaxID=351052 RepID=A0A3E0WH27_9GAMM|nr:GFA family protein [Alkalilimnicola ehrlichii]RFA25202.1 alanine acetyltransferase [Alkalilimnicola ehrlichii]RFA32280.1 alanine acetyltransferase [Alkalilimnicola ehrlichii]